MPKQKESQVKLGGDPEFFVKDLKSGKIVPSCGLIGGTKGEGTPLDSSGASRWLEDNVAVELNFNPVDGAGDWALMLRNHTRLMRHALAAKGLAPVFRPNVTFEQAELADPRAQVFGCDPDFCAYHRIVSEGLPAPRPVDCGTFVNDRFAGGHLHLSYTKTGEVPDWAVVMLLDAFIGLPMVLVEKQGLRRKNYGLAGLFRPKPYGIEYRTLSNHWLMMAYVHNAHPIDVYRSACGIWQECFGASVLSIGRFIEDDPVGVSRLFTRLPKHDIQEAINNEDVQQATELYNFIKALPEVRKETIYSRVYYQELDNFKL